MPEPNDARVLHQLKNHISVVLGFSELILESDLSGQVRADVLEIRKAAEAALRDLRLLTEGSA
jgi:hypothetical protein